MRTFLIVALLVAGFAVAAHLLTAPLIARVDALAAQVGQ